MNEALELAWRAVIVGAGATLVMDLWAALLRRFGVPSLDFALLGRWIGHLARGRVMHANITAAPPIPAERWIGWSAHYSIGLAFAGLLLSMYGLGWARSPSVVPALSVGIATVVAPLFILQPAMGFGVASRRTSRPLFNSLKSLTTHVVFGLGMYIAGLAAAAVLPAGK